jgi:hypothetical protein
MRPTALAVAPSSTGTIKIRFTGDHREIGRSRDLRFEARQGDRFDGDRRDRPARFPVPSSYCAQHDRAERSSSARGR